MNRSFIAALCLTTALGSINLAVAMDPQPSAQTGATQPLAREIVDFVIEAGLGNLEAVKKWVTRGRDVNANDYSGWNALAWASHEGHLPVVQYLLENGADVNAKHGSGFNALMRASNEGHLPVVQYLVEKGADVNAKNEVERTALMEASLGGHLEVVQYLVEKGADPNAKDILERTARGMAEGKQKQAIIDFLNIAMQDPDALKKQKLWDARVKALKDAGFLRDPAKADMNDPELKEFKDAITCPITLEIMRDPVRAKTGIKNAQGQEQYTHAYEREAIKAWLKQSPLDPLTKLNKNINDYESDMELAKRIQVFMDKHVPQ